MKTRFEYDVDFRRSDWTWLAYWKGKFLFAIGHEYLRTMRPETHSSYLLSLCEKLAAEAAD